MGERFGESVWDGWARRERKRMRKLPLFAQYKIDTKVSDELRDVPILGVTKFGERKE